MDNYNNNGNFDSEKENSPEGDTYSYGFGGAATEMRPKTENGEQGGNGEPEKPKKKHSGKARVWIARCVTVIVVAAVAFGGAYAGNTVADKNTRQVIIQQGATATDSDTAQSTSALEEGLSSEEIAAKAVPSVVAITTEEMTTSNYWYGSQVVGGAGSGVILSEDGYILTNYHVAGSADNIKVELYDGTTYDAQLVGSYSDGDIAVIKIDATGLQPVTFADSDQVKQGQTVFAIGNPEGRFSGSMTGGMISAIERNISVALETDDSTGDSYGSYGSVFGYTNQKTINLTVFQFDAAVSPGNSGGGLFNTQGELIGLVCAKSSDSSAEGLGFAITGNNALEIATSIITTGSYVSEDDGSGSSGDTTATNTNKAVLGITAAYLDANTAAGYGYVNAGVYVISITEQSTADAGLLSGDRIISVDDVMVSAVSDVTDYLANKAPGDQVALAIERSGKMISIQITLAENTSVS